MAPASKAVTASRLLTVAALLACCKYASAAHLGGRRGLHSWVAESGSFSVETGVSKPSTYKTKTEVTWDHDAKAPEPEPAAPPPAPAKSAPAPPEEKTVQGKQLDFTFNKEMQHAVEINKDAMGTKQILVKDNPQVQVSVDVNKATAASATPAASDAAAPSPQKQTTYVIQPDSHCGCSNCACSGH